MNKDKLHKILRKVEQVFGRGKCSTWRNRDFEDLSFAIHQKTKILISSATLKRIFGKVKVKEDYSPQGSTLDALITYSDYNSSTEKKHSKTGTYIWISGISLALTIILFFVTRHDEKITNPDSIKSSITLVKLEGECPSSAYFSLDYPENTEGLFANFGDENEPFQINKHEQLTHFYGMPGYFDVFLEKNEKRVSEKIKVFVPSNGWKVFARHYMSETDKRNYPVPIEPNTTNGYFHATADDLATLGINTSEIVTVTLSNYRHTNINGDQFVFTARLKNDSFWPAIRCYSAYVLIEGSNGRILFKFMEAGCSAYGEFEIGEIHKTGRTEDLTSFAIDLKKWMDIEVINQNKNVSVQLNGTNIFSKTYTKSIGEIIGTSILFHGSGAVDYLQLTQENKSIFQFEQSGEYEE